MPKGKRKEKVADLEMKEFWKNTEEKKRNLGTGKKRFYKTKRKESIDV